MKGFLIVLVVCVAGVCVAADGPKTDCQKHRDSALEHESIMKLIPTCKENGDYEELQCYKDSKFCVCYDKKGHPASPISSKIKQCNCHLERKRKIDSNHENAFVPQCNDDGSFSRTQCWDFNNSCWCVDENGKQEGQIVSEKSKLNC